MEKDRINQKSSLKDETGGLRDDISWIMDYFEDIGAIKKERCENIISNSGESIGEYDFYFEWFTEPSSEQYHSFIDKIDKAIEPLGCSYTITTK